MAYYRASYRVQRCSDACGTAAYIPEGKSHFLLPSNLFEDNQRFAVRFHCILIKTAVVWFMASYMVHRYLKYFMLRFDPCREATFLAYYYKKLSHQVLASCLSR